MSRIQTWVIVFATVLLTIGMIGSFSMGVGASEPTVSDLDDAIDDVESYEYDTETSTTSTVVEDGEEQETRSEGEGSGAVDVTAGEIKEEITIQSSGDEVLEEGEIETQMYLVDGTYYTATTTEGEEAEWIKMDAPEMEGVTEGPLAEYNLLLESADVDTVGEEEIDGTDTYILEFDVDMDAYWDEMVDELENDEVDAANGDVDTNGAAVDETASEDFDEPTHEMTVTMWVDAETDLPVKSELLIETCMDEFDAYDGDDAAGDEVGTIESMETTMTQTTYFDAYNEPVDIDLPEEAEDAQDFEEQLAELEAEFDEDADYDVDDEGAEYDMDDEDLEEYDTEGAVDDAAEDDC